jgi:hypothetical protein
MAKTKTNKRARKASPPPATSGSESDGAGDAPVPPGSGLTDSQRKHGEKRASKLGGTAASGEGSSPRGRGFRNRSPTRKVVDASRSPAQIRRDVEAAGAPSPASSRFKKAVRVSPKDAAAAARAVAGGRRAAKRAATDVSSCASGSEPDSVPEPDVSTTAAAFEAPGGSVTWEGVNQRAPAKKKKDAGKKKKIDQGTSPAADTKTPSKTKFSGPRRPKPKPAKQRASSATACELAPCPSSVAAAPWDTTLRTKTVVNIAVMPKYRNPTKHYGVPGQIAPEEFDLDDVAAAIKRVTGTDDIWVRFQSQCLARGVTQRGGQHRAAQALLDLVMHAVVCNNLTLPDQYDSAAPYAVRSIRARSGVVAGRGAGGAAAALVSGHGAASSSAGSGSGSDGASGSDTDDTDDTETQHGGVYNINHAFDECKASLAHRYQGRKLLKKCCAALAAQGWDLRQLQQHHDGRTTAVHASTIHLTRSSVGDGGGVGGSRRRTRGRSPGRASDSSTDDSEIERTERRRKRRRSRRSRRSRSSSASDSEDESLGTAERRRRVRALAKALDKRAGTVGVDDDDSRAPFSGKLGTSIAKGQHVPMSQILRGVGGAVDHGHLSLRDGSILVGAVDDHDTDAATTSYLTWEYFAERFVATITAACPFANHTVGWGDLLSSCKKYARLYARTVPTGYQLYFERYRARCFELMRGGKTPDFKPSRDIFQGVFGTAQHSTCAVCNSTTHATSEHARSARGSRPPRPQAGNFADPAATSDAVGAAPPDSRPCGYFQKERGCIKQGCPRPHTCQRCGKAGHGKSSCSAPPKSPAGPT